MTMRSRVVIASLLVALALLLARPAGGLTGAAYAQNSQADNASSSASSNSSSSAASAPVRNDGRNPIAMPRIQFGITPSNAPEDVSVSMQILLLLTVLTLAPSILIMVTSFTRIIIVLSFVRRALATQQLPSNQILVGLALILTFFTMAPVWGEINEKAVQPYLEKKISQIQAYEVAVDPLRKFMLRQTREKDLALFAKLAADKKPMTRQDVPLYVVVPAFITSELKLSFEMGIIIFIPFLVIDMVVASTLMSMGMIMLPPVMISLPFKILLFVLVDGWHLVIKSVVQSFK
jgi:flagellar biosynthesis protein FliP